MLRSKVFLKQSLLVIFIISFIFSFLKGIGVYGFGNDYYVIYNEHNLNFGSLFNRLGWIISTFSLKNIHLGVYLTSLILTISFGVLLRSIFQIQKLYDIYFFTFILVIGFHCWPIIMSTSNAMRQGLCMSMIFFYITFYLKKKILISLCFVVLSLFMHKSGPFISLIFLFTIFVKYLSERIKYFQSFNYIIFGVLIFFICFILLQNFEHGERQSRIIFKDYRYHFLILGFLYFVIFHYKDYLFRQNIMNLFVYYYFFGSLSVLVATLNFEYERLQMMMLIPLIFSIGLLFNKKSSYIYYTFVYICLLILTVHNGMYESFS